MVKNVILKACTFKQYLVIINYKNKKGCYMELMKDSMAYGNFKKIEKKVFKCAEINQMDDFHANDYIERFIWAFSTNEEQNKIQEYTYQIASMIDKIHADKNTMLSEIDVSYLFASNLQLFCLERAKLYMNAIDRIENYYLEENIHSYIVRFKNL
jgi:hypothetical protein